jgi:hypothetical protein
MSANNHSEADQGPNGNPELSEIKKLYDFMQLLNGLSVKPLKKANPATFA